MGGLLLVSQFLGFVLLVPAQVQAADDVCTNAVELTGLLKASNQIGTAVVAVDFSGSPGVFNMVTRDYDLELYRTKINSNGMELVADKAALKPTVSTSQVSFSYKDTKDIAGQLDVKSYRLLARQANVLPGLPPTVGCSNEATVFTQTTRSNVPPCPTQIKEVADTARVKGTIKLSWALGWLLPAADAKPAVFKAVFSEPKGQATQTLGQQKAADEEEKVPYEGTLTGLTAGRYVFKILAYSGENAKSEECLSSKVMLQVDAEGGVTFYDNSSTDQYLAGVATLDRCGESGNIVTDFVKVFPYMFCRMVVSFKDVSTSLVSASAVFLANTSGLPISQDVTKDSGGPFLDFINGNGGTFIGPVEDKLVDTSPGSFGLVIQAAYQRTLNLVNSVVLIILIIIALANILQIEINTYSFKKLLPGLIVSVILANASFLVVRGILEVSGQLAQGLIGRDLNLAAQNEPSKDGKNNLDNYVLYFKNFGSPSGEAAPLYKSESDKIADIGKVFQEFILTLFIFAAGVMLFILAFLFAVRTIVFFAAMPLAPLAFLGLNYQPLSFAWKKWWGLVTNWAFMPVVAFFWLWLGFQFFAAIGSTTSASPLNYIMGYCFGIAMIYLAMKTPFTMAGEAKMALNKWDAAGKWALQKSPPGHTYRRLEKRVKDNMKKRDSLEEEGPIFRSRLGRALGGDKLDKALTKQEARIEMKRDELKQEKETLHDHAQEELLKKQDASVSKFGKVVDDWSKSSNFFAKKLGEALKVTGKGINSARTAVAGVRDSYERVVGTTPPRPRGFRERELYKRKVQDQIRGSKNALEQDLTRQYYGDSDNVRRDFEADAAQGLTEKTKKDAKTKAAHQMQQESVLRAKPLVSRIQGHAIPGIDVGSGADVLELSTQQIEAIRTTDANLAGEIEALQKAEAGTYKSSKRHLQSKHKEDTGDYRQKKVTEYQLSAFDVDNVSALLGVGGKTAADITDKEGKPDEVGRSELIVRLNALVQTATSGREQDYGDAAQAANNLLTHLNGVNTKAGATIVNLTTLQALANELVKTKPARNTVTGLTAQVKKDLTGPLEMINKIASSPGRIYG
jgi:hypothetical protein